MKKILAIAATLLLVAAPMTAQAPIPDGTVGIFVYQIVGGEPVQIGDPVVVLPAQQACLPDDVT